MRVFVTLFFESSWYIHCSLCWWVHKYWVFWMVGFLYHLLMFLQWIICSSSDFHPAMPTLFCNLPYRNFIYWKFQLSFSIIFSYIVLWVTVIMPVIYPLLFIAVAVVCVFIWVAEWQRMCIVELISTGNGQIMETLDNIGIKLFVLAAL